MKQSFDTYKKKQQEHWNRGASWSKSACSVGALTDRNTFEGGHLLERGMLIRMRALNQNNTYDIPLTERILLSMKLQAPQFLNDIPYFYGNFTQIMGNYLK